MGACVGTPSSNNTELEKTNPENEIQVFDSPTKKIKTNKLEVPYLMRLSEDKQNYSA